jgi:hypothetical protein
MENLPWDLTKLSALYVAVTVYQRLSNPTHSGKIIPQTLRWEGGTGHLVEALRRRLAEHRVEILEKSPVESVDYDGETVSVTISSPSGSNKIISGRLAVFAISPSVTGKIKFHPPLPSPLQNANASVLTWDDPALNVLLTFDQNFWKTKNLQTNYLPSPIGRVDPHCGKIPKEDRCFGAIMDLTPVHSRKGMYLGIFPKISFAKFSENRLKDKSDLTHFHFPQIPADDLKNSKNLLKLFP